MCEALDDLEGSINIRGWLITNFRFADDIVVNAEEEEEAGILIDRLDRTTTSYKMEIGPHKPKVIANNPNGFQRDQDTCKRSDHNHHHHHIHFRALFSSTEGWAFWQVFLEGVLSTQNDFEGQQNPYLASFCHSQALHLMISLACQIFSVQPHSACVLLQSSLCCALHVQTISSYGCGAPI